MSSPPVRPKVYHITHVENLGSIASGEEICSDAERLRQGFTCMNVGLTEIKHRRLTNLEVRCHPGTKVGEYVPFYFCPRSIMLYLLHRGNRPGIAYSGGQRPIVHLVADLKTVVRWAEEHKRRWAFSSGNAGASYVDFYCNLADLNLLNWAAVQAVDFRDSVIKEGKQAEFLLYQTFPWRLVEEIGVSDMGILRSVEEILAKVSHRPRVSVRASWYY